MHGAVLHGHVRGCHGLAGGGLVVAGDVDGTEVADLLRVRSGHAVGFAGEAFGGVRHVEVVDGHVALVVQVDDVRHLAVALELRLRALAVGSDGDRIVLGAVAAHRERFVLPYAAALEQDFAARAESDGLVHFVDGFPRGFGAGAVGVVVAVVRHIVGGAGLRGGLMVVRVRLVGLHQLDVVDAAGISGACGVLAVELEFHVCGAAAVEGDVLRAGPGAE